MLGDANWSKFVYDRGSSLVAEDGLFRDEAGWPAGDDVHEMDLGGN